MEVQPIKLTPTRTAVYRVLLRLERGEKVEPSRSSFGAMSLSDELNRLGVVDVEKTPKGRKAWYVLTNAGRDLLLAARQWQEHDRERAAKLREESDAQERIYQAGPKCYEYVKALAAAGDRAAKRFLAELGL